MQICDIAPTTYTTDASPAGTTFPTEQDTHGNGAGTSGGSTGGGSSASIGDGIMGFGAWLFRRDPPSS